MSFEGFVSCFFNFINLAITSRRLDIGLRRLGFAIFSMEVCFAFHFWRHNISHFHAHWCNLFYIRQIIYHLSNEYFPTVLCGLTYADHFFLAWLISYTFVNLGSIFNMIWVRTLNLACVRSKFSKKIDAFSFLNRLLILQPYKTILLFRLPYLYVGKSQQACINDSLRRSQKVKALLQSCIIWGAVNYVMAFTDVDFKTYIIANAIVIFHEWQLFQCSQFWGLHFRIGAFHSVNYEFLKQLLTALTNLFWVWVDLEVN